VIHVGDYCVVCEGVGPAGLDVQLPKSKGEDAADVTEEVGVIPVGDYRVCW
jgi:hypothetical protein